MDTGARLLAALTDGIVEDEWALPSSNGVLWWPHDLAQVVAVAPDGRVAIATDVAREVPWREQCVAERLAGANRVPRLSTLVVTTDERVRLRTTGHVSSFSSPVLGWLRWLIAVQPLDARFWAEEPDDFCALRASSGHHRGFRDLPSGVLARAADLTDRSWARFSAVDPSWVGQGLARLTRSPVWLDEGRSGLRLPWHLHTEQPERWSGRADLTVSARLELTDVHGPAVVVRTDVPYLVPADRSESLARSLNPMPPSTRVELHSTWHARYREPGVYLQAVLPLGMLADDVGEGPEVVADAVRRVARSQRVQAAQVVPVVEAAIPDLVGPDPWLSPSV